jgi:hypothetical protein
MVDIASKHVLTKFEIHGCIENGNMLWFVSLLSCWIIKTVLNSDVMIFQLFDAMDELFLQCK